MWSFGGCGCPSPRRSSARSCSATRRTTCSAAKRTCSSLYASVPIGAYLILSVLDGKSLFRLGRNSRTFRKWATRRNLFTLVLCVMMGSLGAYYAIFTALILCAAGVAGAVGIWSWRPLVQAAVVIVLIGATMFANDLPTAIYRSNHGDDPAVANRLPAESELYALKLAEMVLPVPGHRLTVGHDPLSVRQHDTDHQRKRSGVAGDRCDHRPRLAVPPRLGSCGGSRSRGAVAQAPPPAGVRRDGRFLARDARRGVGVDRLCYRLRSEAGTAFLFSSRSSRYVPSVSGSMHCAGAWGSDGGCCGLPRSASWVGRHLRRVEP